MISDEEWKDRDMSNDRAFERGQRLLGLKQTGTTRGYIRKLRAVASGLGWDDAALKFYFYHGLSDEVKDIIYLEERPKNTLEQYI